MRTLLALSILTLLGGSAIAGDLRDARSMALQLRKDPSKRYLHRAVHQRNGMVGASISARREDGLITVETWKSKGNVQTTTKRSFSVSAGGDLQHVSTLSDVKHGRSVGAGGTDFATTITRVQSAFGGAPMKSGRVASSDVRTGKFSFYNADGK